MADSSAQGGAGPSKAQRHSHRSFGTLALATGIAKSRVTEEALKPTVDDDLARTESLHKPKPTILTPQQENNERMTTAHTQPQPVSSGIHSHEPQLDTCISQAPPSDTDADIHVVPSADAAVDGRLPSSDPSANGCQSSSADQAVDRRPLSSDPPAGGNPADPAANQSCHCSACCKSLRAVAFPEPPEKVCAASKDYDNSVSALMVVCSLIASATYSTKVLEHGSCSYLLIGAHAALVLFSFASSLVALLMCLTAITNIGKWEGYFSYRHSGIATVVAVSSMFCAFCLSLFCSRFSRAAFFVVVSISVFLMCIAWVLFCCNLKRIFGKGAVANTTPAGALQV